MKIFLRILGQRLFERVALEVAALDSAFPRRLGHAKLLSWHLDRLEAPVRIDQLCPDAAGISVLLIEIHDPSEVDVLWDIGSRSYQSLIGASSNGMRAAPVILVFDERTSDSSFNQMPPIVDDWVLGFDAMNELARRVITSLRRRKYLQEELGTGHLTLNLDTRQLVYHNDAVQLSPAEMPLAELFMCHIGSVIPIEEIQLMFQLAGRSITGSNIRVTIFQLRFKIELLTRNHFTLVCAYGEGYALRPGKAADGPRSRPLEARQNRAAYTA